MLALINITISLTQKTQELLKNLFVVKEKKPNRQEKNELNNKLYSFY